MWEIRKQHAARHCYPKHGARHAYAEGGSQFGLIALGCMLVIGAYILGAVLFAPTTENQSVRVEPTPQPAQATEIVQMIAPEPTLAVFEFAAPAPDFSSIYSTPIPTPETLTEAFRPTPTPAPTPDPQAFAHLMSVEEAANELNEANIPNRLKSGEIDAILSTLPENLGLPRTLIVIKAYSLLGEVPYQYGGKSRELGWDKTWGTFVQKNNGSAATTTPAADGETSSQPDADETTSDIHSARESMTEIGMDCSGFVRWCFNNAAGTIDVGQQMGSGTYKQWLNTSEISIEEALPGDLIFTNKVGKTNHNGIVVQRLGNGKLMVIHSAEDKGIVLEEASVSEFQFARRPDCLSGSQLTGFQSSMLRHKDEPYMVDLRYVLALKG